MTRQRCILSAFVLALVLPSLAGAQVLDDFASDTLGAYEESVLIGTDRVAVSYDSDGESLRVGFDDSLNRNVFLGIAVLDDTLRNGTISGARYRQDASGVLHLDWEAYDLVDGTLKPLHEQLDIDRVVPLHNGGCDIGPKVVSYHKCTCQWVTVSTGRALPSPGRIAFVAGGNDLESLVALVYTGAVYLDYEKLLGNHFFVSGRLGRDFVGGLDTLRLTTDPVPGEPAPASVETH
ncbi:MAG TPA: hypothetical protein VEW48_10810 [Thermoanaerobaculia bacterium]|nr:hypothetical protein [Thermoanaerobaculia bacterium]